MLKDPTLPSMYDNKEPCLFKICEKGPTAIWPDVLSLRIPANNSFLASSWRWANEGKDNVNAYCGRLRLGIGSTMSSDIL